MWEIGPDFFTFPGFKEIVEDRKQSKQDRVEALYHVPDKLDKAAMFGSDWKQWEIADKEP